MERTRPPRGTYLSGIPRELVQELDKFRYACNYRVNLVRNPIDPRFMELNIVTPGATDVIALELYDPILKMSLSNFFEGRSSILLISDHVTNVIRLPENVFMRELFVLYRDGIDTVALGHVVHTAYDKTVLKSALRPQNAILTKLPLCKELLDALFFIWNRSTRS